MPTGPNYREILHSIAVSQTGETKPDLLDLLQETHTVTSGTDLVATYDTGRATVYSRLNDLTEAGLIERTDDGFWITRAGQLARQAYCAARTTLRDETIAFLTGPSHRLTLLRMLASAPSTKAELAANESLPSRRTIHRTINWCERHEKVRKTADGKYTTDESVEKLLTQFTQLETDFEQLTAKADCLNQLAYWADPPLTVLRGGELIANTEGDPYAMLDAAVEAADLRSHGLDHVRSVTPLFDRTLFDIFGQFIDGETTFEIIFDQQTYQQLTNPRHLHYLAGAIAAPAVDLRIHPDPLYTGLGIYNRRTVMLGGTTRESRDYGVVGNGDAFRNWAETTFESLWAESAPPSERFTHWVAQSVPTPLSSS